MPAARSHRECSGWPALNGADCWRPWCWGVLGAAAGLPASVLSGGGPLHALVRLVHLSVLPAALSIGRLLPRTGRLAVAALALAGFRCWLVLAFKRAVLMGSTALLIQESGERSRGWCCC